MHVSRLALTDFRSYPEVLVELDPGASTLIGPNGQGKTNLVEAIGYVATLGSHRVATDAPLVRSGAERAVVRCEIQRDGRIFHVLADAEDVEKGVHHRRLGASDGRLSDVVAQRLRFAAVERQQQRPRFEPAPL